MKEEFIEFCSRLIGERTEETDAWMILEDMDVLAMLIKQSLPNLETGVDICSSMYLQASLQANLSRKTTSRECQFFF